LPLKVRTALDMQEVESGQERLGSVASRPELEGTETVARRGKQMVARWKDTESMAGSSHPHNTELNLKIMLVNQLCNPSCSRG
jgi:hypothetical protein